MISEPKNAVELDQISVAYRHQRVLDQLSLSIGNNEIVCLLGQSGSGKTTILKSLAGLLPLQQGEIRLHEQVLSSSKECLSPEKRGISIIFQDFALFPHMTVLENVCFGMNVKGQPANDKAMALLAMVKMSNYEHVYPSELSGGQQQRVAIARALATDPKVLLLDEPFSNVDHHLKEQLMLDIRRVLKQQQTPALFVTHSKEEAFTFADKLAFMESGKITQQGTAESLYFQPKTASLAESMGEGNWLDVVTISETETQSSQLGSILSTVPHERALSSEWRQFIRPNQILIEANPSGRAEVFEQTFNGESRHYFVRIADLELRVSAVSSSESLAIGSRVDVSIVPHQAILFENS